MTSEPASLRFDADGLVPAIVQVARTGRVQMLAWMNAEALAETRRTRRVTFYSRSRARLWVKGESSGHVLDVVDVHLDCDGDAILVRAIPHGPSCHTNADTCFFRSIDDHDADCADDVAEPTLVRLERDIAARRSSDAGASYTKSLLDAGASKIGDTLRAAAAELARAIVGESEARVASEAADVLYHWMVALAARDVSLAEVLDVLESRRGVSGLEEKRRRSKAPPR
ncbi:MAG: bifunctional phosphoribosyl-AMP cyclohydrolase/phosphoribosyl-ATP diphosphatase HisIE [Polyangiales bacterium]